MHDPARRSALRMLGGFLLVALGAAAAIPSMLYLFDPLNRRKPDEPGPGGDGAPEPLPVASLGDVPDLGKGGAPLRATVTADAQRDAWNRYESTRIGSVWLCRTGDDLAGFSTICPHAGCGVDFDPNQRLFVCPCHGSTFGLDGTRRDGPSPRDLDRLDVDVKEGMVRCRYQRFRPASDRKEPA